MTPALSEGWADLGLFSLFRSRFLVPSVALHLLALYLVLGVKTLPDLPTAPPVPIQLLEFEGTSPDRSIGPGRGPGGPKSRPKLGSPTPPQQAAGKVDAPAAEAPTPVDDPAPAPKAPPLPGPKALAGPTRSEPLSVKETTPDSLVQLPTRPSSGTSVQLDGIQKGPAPANVAEDAGRIGALKEGASIPGALKGNGSGTGPYGVAGGSRTGSGVTGGGTGTGTGGGSATGLKGASAADYNQYLEQLRRRVNSVWRYPDDVSGVQKVTIRFSLDRAGKLSQAEVVESSDSRLNASAIDAMKRASPFPPIPESLKDLAGEPLLIRFNVSIRLRG